MAKNVAKVGVSVATGTAPLALLNIGTQYAEGIFTDDQKRDEFISKAGALLKGTSEAAVINISDSIPQITLVQITKNKIVGRNLHRFFLGQ